MAEYHLFDRTLKIPARDHAELFVRLALPGAPVELIGSPQNVEISLAGAAG
jgi:hypothetical protein